MAEHVLDSANPALAQPGYGPSWLQRVREPVDNLRQLGRRAALALLGIAVGCMAVVALLTIGHNAEQQAMNVFKGMGSDLLVANLRIPDEGRNAALPATPALKADALRTALPGIAAAAPLIIASADARLKGHALSTTLLGSTAELHRVLDLQRAQGRLLSRFDTKATHAVLGADVAAEWERSGIHPEPGDRVQIDGYVFQVIGILRPAGQNPLLPAPVDDAILLPADSMRRILPNPQITSVLARSPASESLAQLAPALHQWLATQMPGYEVDVQIPRQLLEGMAKQSRLFSWLLAGLGSLALLVGGIGVMNVMVMNVAERRREIGVRMALGARPRDIAILFLLEAVVLAAIGASLGSLAGLIAGWAFVHFSAEAAFAMSPTALPLGIGSAVATGLFFGLSPAMAAARLTPVQALRDA